MLLCFVKLIVLEVIVGFELLLLRYLAKEKAASDLERKLMAAESQVNELQARLNDAVNQRRHAEDELNVRPTDNHKY